MRQILLGLNGILQQSPVMGGKVDSKEKHPAEGGKHVDKMQVG